MNLEQAISEAFAIKHQINELKSRYTDLQNEIISQVQIPEGKRTGYADSGDIRAKVQVSEKYKWDQKKLNAVRAKIGDHDFFWPSPLSGSLLIKKASTSSSANTPHRSSVRSFPTP